MSEEMRDGGVQVSFRVGKALRAAMWTGALLAIAGLALTLTVEIGWLWLRLLLYLLMSCAFLWQAIGLTRHPFLVFGKEALEVRWVVGSWRAVSLAWSEITGVKWENERAICLELEGGRSYTLALAPLSRLDREEVRRLVHERLKGSARESADRIGA